MDWALVGAGVWIALMGVLLWGWSVAKARDRAFEEWEEQMYRRALARRVERDGE